MVLVSLAQLLKGEVVEVVDDNHVVKPIGNLEGVIKASSSTILNGNGQPDFMCWLACISSNSPKKVDQIVVWMGVVII